MRIAQIVPHFVRIPPTGYGGVERIASLLTEGLVKNGHEVTLLASGDSETNANLEYVIEEAPGLSGPNIYDDEITHIAHAYLQADQFDIVHDHSWWGPYFGALVGRSKPVVSTVHMPIQGFGIRAQQVIGDRVQRVAVSDHQRSSSPGIPWVTRIYNGLDIGNHPFVHSKEDYLVFVGRTAPEKGPELAVDVAQRTGKHLKLIIKREEAAERAHWDSCVVPRLRGDEEIIEGATHSEKVGIIGAASGLLFPVQWPEPFGLVMVEAMACGTPVIALQRGAVSEVVQHGTTGFIADSPKELDQYVSELRTISPEACRARAEVRFSAERMVAEYDALYQRLLGA